MSKNKYIVITGATSGIGLAATKKLFKKGYNIIGVGRSKEKCERAKKQIKAFDNDRKVDFFIADLSSQEDIRTLCADITDYINKNNNGILDVLINNAGVFTTYYTLTNEGIEMQFAVNHLAHFMITNLLMPLLQNSEDPRILTTSSGSHYGAKINFNDIMLSKHYGQLKAYKQVKLANVLFTHELNNRFGDKENIKAYAIDPGLVNTSMGDKHTVGLAKLIWSIRRKSGVSPEEGCKTMIYLASEQIPYTGNYYFKNCKPKEPNKRAKDVLVAKRLWELSEKMCNLNT